MNINFNLGENLTNTEQLNLRLSFGQKMYVLKISTPHMFIFNKGPNLTVKMYHDNLTNILP